MIACPPPAPAAVVNVAAAERLVAELFSIGQPVARVCGGDLGGDSGREAGGTVWVSDDDASLPRVALHEVLHAMVDNAGGFGADLALEEGLTEAVTRDLMPSMWHRDQISRRTLGILVLGSSSTAYTPQVVDVRRWSAGVCGQPWTSWCARLVRRQALLTWPRPQVPVRPLP